MQVPAVYYNFEAKSVQIIGPDTLEILICQK